LKLIQFHLELRFQREVVTLHSLQVNVVGLSILRLHRLQEGRAVCYRDAEQIATEQFDLFFENVIVIGFQILDTVDWEFVHDILLVVQVVLSIV
jgi:hypothetical protein